MAENYFNLHLKNSSSAQGINRASAFKPEFSNSFLKHNQFVETELRTDVNKK
jgi:hypothetical protein